MEEKVLNKKKNGIAVLLMYVVLTAADVICLVHSVRSGSGIAVALCIVWLAVSWILLLGLKVVGPQEALVLTLFGKYYGTIKDNGFYFVNPFCTAVNPAAETKLNQSGDVENDNKLACGGDCMNCHGSTCAANHAVLEEKGGDK